MTTRVVVATTLDAFERTTWDEISDNLIQTYDYLQALCESEVNDCVYRYFGVLDDSDRLLAHACFYSIDTPLDLFLPRDSRLATWFGRIRRWHPNFLVFRTIECGSPAALGSPIACRTDLDRATREKVCSALATRMRAFAKQMNADLIVVRDFSDEQLSAARDFEDSGFVRVNNLDTTRLAVRWPTFEAYLASLRHKYRNMIQADLRRASQAGLRAEYVEEFAELAPQLARLWQATFANSVTYQREFLDAAFFSSISRRLRGRVFVQLYRTGEEIIGFVLYQTDGDVLQALYLGQDYAHAEHTALYFNMAYDALRTAIERGAKVLDLGISTYDFKRRLGAQVVRQHMFMRHRWQLLTTPVVALYRHCTPLESLRERRVFREPTAFTKRAKSPATAPSRLTGAGSTGPQAK